MRKQRTVRQEQNEGVNQPPGFPHFLLRQTSTQPTLQLTSKKKFSGVSRVGWTLYAWVCTDGSQKSLLSVFFSHSSPYVLKEDLSLNLELTNLARLDG